MSNVLIVLIALAAVAAVVALVRGIVMFLRTKDAEVHGSGPSLSSQRQNKMMQARIGFQAAAVVLVVLLLLLNR